MNEVLRSISREGVYGGGRDAVYMNYAIIITSLLMSVIAITYINL